MKKKWCGIVSFVCIFWITACSNFTSFPAENEITEERAQASPEIKEVSKTMPEVTIASEEILTPIVVDTDDMSIETEETDEPNIEVNSQVYTLHHESDGTMYFMVIQEDFIPLAIAAPDLIDSPVYRDTKSFSRNRLMRLLDGNGNQIQTILLEELTTVGTKFEDVNGDGYLDIVLRAGGFMNEAFELFIWDPLTQNFTRVIYEGFEMLSFFSIYDGYIENFLRGSSPEDSIKQKLLWDGNILYLESIIG